MDSLGGGEQGKKLLLDYQLPTRLEEIEKLADAVNAVLPGRTDLAFAANLCLEELVANTILYGLKGRADRLIHIRLSLSDQWLEITIKDDAPPFDPFTRVPEPDLGLGVGDRPVGGLGIHLVRTIMDDARACYDGTGNLIVLRKKLGAGD
jgi:serine/threonine-protein kinase RsbW